MTGFAHFTACGEHADGWNLCFDAPLAVHVAEQIDQVESLFSRVQRATDAGRWVAMAVSYEAAPAFDSAYAVQPAQPGQPLVWAAEYAAPIEAPAVPVRGHRAAGWHAELRRDDYLAAIARIREYIREGDTYQVNYTFPFSAAFEGCERSWFEALRQSQRAGYGACLDLGRWKLLSLSPELFFARRGNRLMARPMKGTARPGATPAETRAVAAELAASEKDRAENLMIVDLLRNDLSRVAQKGSVKVPKLFEVEHYPSVLQMTSSIEAECAPKTDLWSLFRALFPCGSITGAPKVRTMEIIRELEVAPRGFYCGAIGYVKPGGDCQFNVPIRTVQLDSRTGLARYSTGSGVTYGSEAQREYEECLLKTRFLQLASDCSKAC